MDGVFKTVNQKVNLGWRQMPYRTGIAILKDGFFENPSKNEFLKRVLTNKWNLLKRHTKLDLSKKK